jgi:hypothetical protein
MTTAPRVVLAAMQERLQEAAASPHGLSKREQEKASLVAALTAVFEWCDDAEAESKDLLANPSNGDEVTEACTLRDAVNELRKTITDHLPGGPQ